MNLTGWMFWDAFGEIFSISIGFSRLVRRKPFMTQKKNVERKLS
jgi:hypothetical protein